MIQRRLPFLAAVFTLATAPLLAQYTTPNVTTTPGDEAATLGATVFINHGLVGIGRISASATDPFGESFGSVSSLQVTNWTRQADGSYTGTFNILPDRGYNSGAFYSDYAARIAQVNFAFAPYTGSSGIGGATDADKIAAQQQIRFTSAISGLRFTYLDPTTGPSFTTGLDPANGFTSLFGNIVPYVFSYTGLASPSALTQTTYPDINKLPLDSEALLLKADGSGYVGDEYGGNVYYFDATKQIVGVIVPPAAMQPHLPAGVPYYSSAANPANGRRPNQGLEGAGLSPDGSRLFVLLQSATMQDSDSNNDQSRRQTRLLVYDVSGAPVPSAPIGVYAVTLPTYKANGNGGAVNKTGQQSEVVALDAQRFLFLPRDGNGLGNSSNNPSVYKSVRLVDLGVGAPTNFVNDAAKNAEGGTIATLNNGTATLVAGITPVVAVEAVNVLNSTQLTKFNVKLDTGGQVSKLTLGEKWEGMSLMPANDPFAPDDYFLFVGNDNDFLTSAGIIRGPGGLVTYNGFNGYPAARIPAPVGSANNENDTMILAYRVTVTTPPAVTRSGLVFDRRTGKFTQQLTLQNTTANTFSGPIHVALDSLSPNATLANATGTTANQLPAGSPYITIIPPGGTLAPGATASVVLQFTNPTMGAITYTPRVLVLTGPALP